MMTFASWLGMAVWLLALFFNMGVVGRADAQAAQAGKAGQATPAAKTADSKDDAAKGAEAKKDDPDAQAQFIRGLWWNRSSMIDALKLSFHQREMMDDAFRKGYADERSAREAIHDLRDAYHEDIKSGHWGAARQSANKLAEASKTFSLSQMTSRVDVLALLSEEQMQIMLKSHERLLFSNWLTEGRRGRSRRPSADGKRPGGTRKEK